MITTLFCKRMNVSNYILFTETNTDKTKPIDLKDILKLYRTEKKDTQSVKFLLFFEL